MSRIDYYWMCKCDGLYYVIPAFTISNEKVDNHRVIGFSISFLNRWCAVNFHFKSKEVSHA